MTEPIKGLTEGRMVHYVLPEGPYQGWHRPAVIVRVWDNYGGTCNLQVFTDGDNDELPYIHWATSIRYSENKELGTWHWIEQA